jgi:UV DNA damage endonuclease
VKASSSDRRSALARSGLQPSPTTPTRLPEGLRLGLCCVFAAEPIKFRTTTAAVCQRLSAEDRSAKLADICRANAEALFAAIECCARRGIGSFRVNSQILPLKTHPECGYDLRELPDGEAIVERFLACGELASRLDVRTTFHPDQFVVLSSPREEVVVSSLAEIEYQAEVAQWIGADVINVHAGGVYDSAEAALERFARNLERLSDAARERLTIENDDKLYAVEPLLPLCQREGVPLVYDVHHHRCRRDGLTAGEATEQARSTWNREPLFHISSPKEGWGGPGCHRHHDYVAAGDFPDCWLGWPLTVEVEAKAKELAIEQLAQALACRT